MQIREADYATDFGKRVGALSRANLQTKKSKIVRSFLDRRFKLKMLSLAEELFFSRLLINSIYYII